MAVERLVPCERLYEVQYGAHGTGEGPVERNAFGYFFSAETALSCALSLATDRCNRMRKHAQSVYVQECTDGFTVSNWYFRVVPHLG